jgi:predicted nucleic acid-binding protein
MLAVDTNLIVRYLTGDRPGQSAKARAPFTNIARTKPAGV